MNSKDIANHILMGFAMSFVAKVTFSSGFFTTILRQTCCLRCNFRRTRFLAYNKKTKGEDLC